MKNQRDDTGVRYFFTGEFRKYKKMFERHCPPPMKVPKGMQLCKCHEARGWMYYLCSGRMKVYVNNCEGNDRIVAFLEKDTIFGLDHFSPEQTSLVTIECMTDAWVMPFDGQTLETMIHENPEFAVELTRYYCKIVRQLCHDAQSQSVNNVFVRTIDFLRINWGEEDNSRVPLSQRDIAEAVNCSRSSIARVCRALKQAGVIVSEGVGFRIVDHAGLSALRGKYVSFR